MTADTLPWQSEQWRQLGQLLERERLPHGLMLVGPGEIGKAEFARNFAQHLLCHTPVSSMACGRCKACLLFQASTHPDFLAIEPEEAGKAIKVDQIRQLGEFSTKTASMGPRRVIVVSPAEAMNINAANAFLKTLEEPGEGVVLLLVVHQPGLVLPTIRSRCRLLMFHLPQAAQVSIWLREKGHSGEEVERAMAPSGGRPFRAKRLLETELNDLLVKFQQTMAAVEARRISPLDAAKVLQGLPKQDAIEWFQYSVYEKIREFVGEPDDSARKLFSFLDRLTVVRQRLLSSANPNPQLAWEELLMDWKSVIDLQG